MMYLSDIQSEVTTWCNHDPTPDPIITIKYGALYNWYAATDVRNICSVGWHLQSRTEILTLITYLDIDGTAKVNDAGGYLKEVGLTYWDNPNTGATNTMGYNGRGSGYRVDAGFIYLNQGFIIWLINGVDATVTTLLNTHAILYTHDEGYFNAFKRYGLSLRPMKDTTTLTHGETGTYVDPSGYSYRTVCIGTQEIVADNIATKHYRNGDDIPVVTDNATWNALVTGAMCYYNNDISNM